MKVNNTVERNSTFITFLLTQIIFILGSNATNLSNIYAAIIQPKLFGFSLIPAVKDGSSNTSASVSWFVNNAGLTDYNQTVSAQIAITGKNYKLRIFGENLTLIKDVGFVFNISQQSSVALCDSVKLNETFYTKSSKFTSISSISVDLNIKFNEKCCDGHNKYLTLCIETNLIDGQGRNITHWLNYKMNSFLIIQTEQQSKSKMVAASHYKRLLKIIALSSSILSILIVLILLLPVALSQINSRQSHKPKNVKKLTAIEALIPSERLLLLSSRTIVDDILQEKIRQIAPNLAAIVVYNKSVTDIISVLDTDQIDALLSHSLSTLTVKQLCSKIGRNLPKVQHTAMIVQVLKKMMLADTQVATVVDKKDCVGVISAASIADTICRWSKDNVLKLAFFSIKHEIYALQNQSELQSSNSRDQARYCMSHNHTQFESVPGYMKRISIRYLTECHSDLFGPEVMSGHVLHHFMEQAVFMTHICLPGLPILNTAWPQAHLHANKLLRNEWLSKSHSINTTSRVENVHCINFGILLLQGRAVLHFPAHGLLTTCSAMAFIGAGNFRSVIENQNRTKLHGNRKYEARSSLDFSCSHNSTVEQAMQVSCSIIQNSQYIVITKQQYEALLKISEIFRQNLHQQKQQQKQQQQQQTRSKSRFSNLMSLSNASLSNTNVKVQIDSKKEEMVSDLFDKYFPQHVATSADRCESLTFESQLTQQQQQQQQQQDEEEEEEINIDESNYQSDLKNEFKFEFAVEPCFTV